MVQKFESPTAIFEVNPAAVERNVETEISMTDLSVNPAYWFWQLSDGKTSHDQNPKFTVNTFSPITVNLTITAENGCQDTATVVVDLITGLDDPELRQSWVLYPNPTEGVLLYDIRNKIMGSYRISVYNAAGILIRQKEFHKSAEWFADRIDLTGLTRGIYLIQLIEPSGNFATKRVLIR